MKVLAASLRPFLTAVQVVAYLLVLGRIFSSGLHTTYFWFTVYICYETVRTAAMSFIPLATKLYGYVYFSTQPITWCLYLVVILEMYQLALKKRGGIAKMAQRALMLALAISTLVSVAIIAFESRQPEANVIHTYVLIERLILSTLLLLLLLFTAFLAYFPMPVTRNTVAHTRIFACYFLFKTILLIFRNSVTGDAAHGVNIVLGVLSTASLLAWTLMLSRAGEEIETTTSYWRDPQVEERLVAQVDAINQTLLSSAKKRI